jgi:hypothetical protein
MLLKSSFNTTTHDHTQVWKHRKHSQISDGLFFPTHHAAQILLPKISISFGALKDAILGKWFGSDDDVIEEVASSTKFKPVQEGVTNINS